MGVHTTEQHNGDPGAAVKEKILECTLAKLYAFYASDAVTCRLILKPGPERIPSVQSWDVVGAELPLRPHP